VYDALNMAYIHLYDRSKAL